MFEQAFKNIDDVLWKEAGCTTELNYTEQSSWLLFLTRRSGRSNYPEIPNSSPAKGLTAKWHSGRPAPVAGCLAARGLDGCGVDGFNNRYY
jgi:hypothetical protein